MSGSFEIKVDASKITALANNFAMAKEKMPAALKQAVNTIGPPALAAMKDVLPGQTGLTTKVVNKALVGKSSGATYVIKSKGGDIRLKYFMARETSKGVTAAPWNQRRLYPATFIKSGWWPNRVAPIARGQVLRRRGESQYPMQVVKSGLFIAEEMIKGASATMFYHTVDAMLPPIVAGILSGAIVSKDAARNAQRASARAINARLSHVSLNDPIPF